MHTLAGTGPAALLERERELEHVRAALRAVGQRAGKVLVIEGAAGIGKSRLLEEARLRATDLGFCVLSARATELEQGFPFGVVRQLFERQVPTPRSRSANAWLAGAAALSVEVLTGRRPPRRRRRTGRGAIPATHGSTACTGSPRTSPATRRWRCSSTIFSGAMRRRRARSRSSPGGSRASRSR